MAILSMLLVLALVPLYLWKRRQDNSQSSEDHREEQQVLSFSILSLLSFIQEP